MQGFIAGAVSNPEVTGLNLKGIIKDSIEYAKELINQLDKEENNG